MVKRLYFVLILFTITSVLATCYLPVAKQTAPADAFLPLVVLGTWISIVAAAGIAPLRRESRSGLLRVVLLGSIMSAALLLLLEFWIVTVILGRDFTQAGDAVQILSNTLYVVTFVGAVLAPIVVLVWWIRNAWKRA